MKIVAIEQTPNPNSMRVVLDTELPAGTSYNYKKSDVETAVEPAASVLKIDGVNGIYHVMNFMAVERSGDVDWETILSAIEVAIPNE